MFIERYKPGSDPGTLRVMTSRARATRSCDGKVYACRVPSRDSCQDPTITSSSVFAQAQSKTKCTIDFLGYWVRIKDYMGAFLGR